MNCENKCDKFGLDKNKFALRVTTANNIKIVVQGKNKFGDGLDLKIQAINNLISMLHFPNDKNADVKMVHAALVTILAALGELIKSSPIKMSSNLRGQDNLEIIKNYINYAQDHSFRDNQEIQNLVNKYCSDIEMN